MLKVLSLIFSLFMMSQSCFAIDMRFRTFPLIEMKSEIDQKNKSGLNVHIEYENKTGKNLCVNIKDFVGSYLSENIHSYIVDIVFGKIIRRSGSDDDRDMHENYYMVIASGEKISGTYDFSKNYTLEYGHDYNMYSFVFAHFCDTLNRNTERFPLESMMPRLAKTHHLSMASDSDGVILYFEKDMVHVLGK